MPKRQKGAGEWIRDYLSRVGQASASEIHRNYQEWLQEQDYPTTEFSSTRREIWLLKEVGLLQQVREGSLNNPGAYRIAPAATGNEPAWSDPTAARYGSR